MLELLKKIKGVREVRNTRYDQKKTQMEFRQYVLDEENMNQMFH